MTDTAKYRTWPDWMTKAQRTAFEERFPHGGHYGSFGAGWEDAKEELPIEKIRRTCQGLLAAETFSQVIGLLPDARAILLAIETQKLGEVINE